MSDESLILNGRYQLLDRIGSGGMALVYKAKDKALGRLVAVKMLHASLTNDADFLARFRQEAYAAANLTHPNIVTVHDIGQDDARHYIVMEYVEGQTLKQIVREHTKNGRFVPVNRAIDLTIQICNGIGYAHRAQLVHCDVKPQNILVTPDDRVKVADFGIARAMSQVTSQQPASQVWGTPQYFAPEQAAGEATTPATDVYAIGVVLFELLTGRLPFEADNPTAMAMQHLNDQPPLITEFNPSAPYELEQIVNKVLAKEPSGRYRTAGQLGRILSSYRQRLSSHTMTTGPVYATGPTAPTPVSEQKTQIHRRPSAQDQPDDDPPTVASTPSGATPAAVPSQRRQRPLRQATAAQAASSRQTAVPPGDDKFIQLPADAMETDWTAVTLGIIALVALLGLIPLWFLVYQAWTG